MLEIGGRMWGMGGLGGEGEGPEEAGGWGGDETGWFVAIVRGVGWDVRVIRL